MGNKVKVWWGRLPLYMRILLSPLVLVGGLAFVIFGMVVGSFYLIFAILAAIVTRDSKWVDDIGEYD